VLVLHIVSKDFESKQAKVPAQKWSPGRMILFVVAISAIFWTAVVIFGLIVL
jgi:hypothetical protein